MIVALLPFVGVCLALWVYTLDIVMAPRPFTKKYDSLVLHSFVAIFGFTSPSVHGYMLAVHSEPTGYLVVCLYVDAVVLSVLAGTMIYRYIAAARQDILEAVSKNAAASTESPEHIPTS